MVKIQKHKAYTYEAEDGQKIDHYKYLVTIPESALAELGWNEGQDLNVVINQHGLMLKAESELKEKGRKK